MLESLLSGLLFDWMLVFARVGTAFANLPTIGEGLVPAPVKLGLALIISAAVTPVVAPSLPPMPDNVVLLFVLIAGEMLFGAFIGTVARLMTTSLQVAGHIIAQETRLAAAQAFNPALASQGSLVGALLGWAGIVMLFATDLHHLLILAVIDSYGLFQPGAAPPVEDFANMITYLVSRTFRVGVEMAAPFLILGMVSNFIMGVIARLAQRIQVFFIFMSAQIFVGLLLLNLVLPAIMRHWMAGFEDFMIRFLPGGG